MHVITLMHKITLDTQGVFDLALSEKSSREVLLMLLLVNTLALFEGS